MREFLLLRLDAPLMSFGGPAVDQNGVTEEAPTLSMIAGLLANALGYDHADVERLEALQARLRFAARCDREGERITDFQTVDLGQAHLIETGWTTWGRPQGRAGASGKETHIRYRHYHADAVYTVALTLEPEEGEVDLDALERALREPERPLYLGRKPCIPSAPLLLGRGLFPSLYAALEGAAPLADGRSRGRDLRAWWPAEEEGAGPSRIVPWADRRDWANRVHAGRRRVREGRVRVAEVSHGG